MAREEDNRARGQIYKGPASAPLKSVPGYKPSSSIPAKFETILFTGPRERKGFSVESRRFQDSENDTPGPGSYDSLKAKPLDSTKPESIGKKGFGALVSNSRRFGGPARPCYTGPGPGTYRGHTAATPNDVKDFSRAPVRSVFQEKTTTSRVPMETAAPHLGPGTYEPGNVTRTGAKLDYLSRPGAGAVSAFKNSVGHELILLGNMEAPPSTSYDLGDLWDRRSLSRGAASRRGTSSFGTGGGRGGASVGSMAPTLDTLLFGAPAGGGKPDTGPGPGAYELQDFASIRAKLSREGARPSPPFQPHDSAPKRPYGGKQMLVSPSEKVAHDYLSPSHPPLHGHSPPHGISSPFRSRSAGHQEFVDERAYAASANAPGPAYYQPPAMLRKSHHKNATQHYTTVAS